ncbi:MAG TPA: GAF domain-containing sensor histidine kinase [Anaerolineales bacterium]|nr:GAF domain-containing sensor histidine kinase [Anaerolineales bacterium]
MISRRLKPLALLFPVLYIGVIGVAITAARPEVTPAMIWPGFAALMVGAVAFTFWIFRLLERREAVINERSEQLAALYKASLALTQELDLAVVLQQVVDLARSLAGAQYGALGVLDPDRTTIAQFLVSGITPEQRQRLGPLPSGKGLLGVLIHSGETLRIPDIASDPRSVGFPENHPEMTSLLGVPIRFKGEVMGDLYLTNKKALNGALHGFTEQDQQILEMFASQAAIVIKNAQLYRQAQQLALLEERERIGMDLHDGVIQSIYAVGLNLEDIQYRLEGEPEVKSGLGHAIEGLNDVIRDIRTYILDLRPQRFQGRDLAEGLAELGRELRAHSFLHVDVVTESDAWRSISPAQTVEILHIAREALTNIRKHARASKVDVTLAGRPGALILTIADNGVGFNADHARAGEGNGLWNMNERAQSLGGSFEIEPGQSAGTRVVLDIPLSE